MRFTYPGVYREEIRTQRQIPPQISTANMALVGFFKKGPVNEPIRVSDLDEAFRLFGDYTSKSIAPTILEAYFANGGQNAFIVRVVGDGAEQAAGNLAQAKENPLTTTAGGGSQEDLSTSNTSVSLEGPVDPGSVSITVDERPDIVDEDTGDDTDGTTGPFTVQTANTPLVPGTVTIKWTDGGTQKTETDSGDGTFPTSGDLTGSPTVDYETGEITFSPSASDAGEDILVDYTHYIAQEQTGEVVGTGTQGVRVYHGVISKTPLFDTDQWSWIEFSWTDSSGTSRTATVDSTGSISGDGSGTVDFETGEFRLEVPTNGPGEGELISVDYWWLDLLEATDDGDGNLQTTGGLLASQGEIDYETGDILSATTVALDNGGAAVEADYGTVTHKFQARHPGEFGNDLRVAVVANENYLDEDTGQYNRFDLVVEEQNDDGDYVAVKTFEGVVLDNLTDENYFAPAVNDPFTGSDLIEVDTPFSADNPDEVQGTHRTGVLIDEGTGSVRDTTALLPILKGNQEGRGIVPGTVTITYTSGGQTKTIEDDGQGSLTGDLNLSTEPSIDYETGKVVFRPSDPPDNGTDIEAEYTVESPSEEAHALFEDGDDGSAIAEDDIIGDNLKANEEGLYALDNVNELLNVAIPDFAGDPDVQSALITYLENRKDSMAIIAPPEGATVRQAINYKRRVLASQSDRAAMYHPYIEIRDPVTGQTSTIPPHGHVAGVIARTDTNRNVGKAPAGTTDGSLRYIRGFAQNFKKSKVGQLTQANINALWQPNEFQPRSVWGARTLEVGGEYRYIQKRRTVDLTSLTVQRAMWWAVFENIGPSLWVAIQEQIRSILRVFFEAGIYAGQTEGEAFFIKVNEENNPQVLQDLGQVIVDYGVATNTPGEFIRLRHRQIIA